LRATLSKLISLLRNTAPTAEVVELARPQADET
jgi:hypothetical protein